MTTFYEARNEMDRLKRAGADLTMMVNPADYESVGHSRFLQGKRSDCLTCGGARFIRFAFPLAHRWFGKAVCCPTCNDA